MPTKSKVKKTKKNVCVDREFLMSLANDIYNSKTHKFLRLCNGKLQNGPDPTNKKRPMHCGLGELYFAMTGRQPERDGVDEDDVVDLAVKLSPLNGLRTKRDREQHAKLDKMISAIKRLNLEEVLDLDEPLNGLLYALEDKKSEIDNDDDDRDDEEANFRRALDAIPGENDDGCSDGVCDTSTYRERSKRVAKKIREAASYLPR